MAATEPTRLTLLSEQTPSPAYARLFQALAEPTRLAILRHLASGEHRVRDLVDHMQLAQSTVSKHLSVLLAGNLVTVRPEGRSSWYRLTDPALLECLLAAADTLLQVTENRDATTARTQPVPAVPARET